MLSLRGNHDKRFPAYFDFTQVQSAADKVSVWETLPVRARSDNTDPVADGFPELRQSLGRKRPTQDQDLRFGQNRFDVNIKRTPAMTGHRVVHNSFFGFRA